MAMRVGTATAPGSMVKRLVLGVVTTAGAQTARGSMVPWQLLEYSSLSAEISDRMLAVIVSTNHYIALSMPRHNLPLYLVPYL